MYAKRINGALESHSSFDLPQNLLLLLCNCIFQCFFVAIKCNRWCPFDSLPLTLCTGTLRSVYSADSIFCLSFFLPSFCFSFSSNLAEWLWSNCSIVDYVLLAIISFELPKLMIACQNGLHRYDRSIFICCLHFLFVWSFQQSSLSDYIFIGFILHCTIVWLSHNQLMNFARCCVQCIPFHFLFNTAIFC